MSLNQCVLSFEEKLYCYCQYSLYFNLPFSGNISISKMNMAEKIVQKRTNVIGCWGKKVAFTQYCYIKNKPVLPSRKFGLYFYICPHNSFLRLESDLSLSTVVVLRADTMALE